MGSGQLRVGVLDLDPLGDFVLVSDQGGLGWIRLGWGGESKVNRRPTIRGCSQTPDWFDSARVNRRPPSEYGRERGLLWLCDTSECYPRPCSNSTNGAMQFYSFKSQKSQSLSTNDASLEKVGRYLQYLTYLTYLHLQAGRFRISLLLRIPSGMLRGGARKRDAPRAPQSTSTGAFLQTVFSNILSLN